MAALAGLGSVAVICADTDVTETAQVLEGAGLRFSVLGSESASDSTGDAQFRIGYAARMRTGSRWCRSPWPRAWNSTT